MKATLLVLKSFPRCYQCSDFSLAGQLSGLECGEFLLILALLWLQWTVSNARETNPFKFHKADLARLPPSVLGRGPGVWGGVTLWASGRAWLASSDKTTTKHTLKKNPLIFQASKNSKTSCLQESRLIYIIISAINPGKTEATVWISKIISTPKTSDEE